MPENPTQHNQTKLNQESLFGCLKNIVCLSINFSFYPESITKYYL